MLQERRPHSWSQGLSGFGDIKIPAGMPQTDSIIAFAAVFSTIGIFSADMANGGQALVVSDPVTTSQIPMTRRNFWPKSVSSAEPSMRGLTSLAFFYLAYRDYKRTTCHRTTSEADVGFASWRWKAWTLCGTIGLAVGPFSPYRVILMRPLEQHLQDQAYLSDEKARRLIARWGKLTLGRGIIIFASFPICLRAFWLRKRGEP